MIPKRNVDFYGDQVRWFIGEVKSVDDPLELGRLQVRINGIHSDSQLDIPDAKLPWAQPMVPITEGGTKGIGNNLGIKVGALVFGVFMDGENSQLPFIMGSMPKFEEDSPGGLSTNQLARGTNTITKTPDPVTDEPSSPYAAKYPKNNVYASESGHVIEIDDTQDSDATNNHGKAPVSKVITKQKLADVQKAIDYMKAGGKIEAIKAKYDLTSDQEKLLQA